MTGQCRPTRRERAEYEPLENLDCWQRQIEGARREPILSGAPNVHLENSVARLLTLSDG
jgi:hypothetical protein